MGITSKSLDVIPEKWVKFRRYSFRRYSLDVIPAPNVAPLRFAPAFRALGVCEHIWLRYKNFDPSCFDPIQKSEYVDLRTNSDFRSRYFDLFPPTRGKSRFGEKKT